MKVPKKWLVPQEIDDLTKAFPAHVIGSLMPYMHEIPQDFQEETKVSRSWYLFIGGWQVRGLGEGTGFVGVILAPAVKEAELGEQAFAHLGTLLRSYEPKHQHKEAAVAWLASLWFERVVWESDLEEAT